MMLSIVVVLPAPLRPTRHTTSCLSTLQRHAVQDVGGPAVGIDRFELEHGQSFRVKASGPEEPSRTIAT